MMKRLLFVLAVFIILNNQLLAQCTCEEDQNNADYCFRHELFAELCIAFFDSSNKALLFGDKSKPTEIKLDAKLSDEFLIKLAENELKKKPLEILFVQKALMEWKTERMKIGHQYTESGLGYKFIKVGDGEMPEIGDEVIVHYTGYLEDGTKFDSSYDRDKPFSFVLGQGRVIKGWDEGIALLQKGSIAILKIPAELGYGSRNMRKIPANSTLIFKIELLDQ